MTDSIRASVGSAVTDFSRSLGTLVGLLWLVLAGVILLEQVAGVSLDAWVLPARLFWLVAFAVAVGTAMWLVDDGYARFGADPAGAWTFVWLAVLFVPLAFFPLRFAVGSIVLAIGSVDSSPVAFNAGFALASAVTAGWLAFYGGLDRLDLELDDFIRVVVYGIALGLVPVVAVVLFDVAWLTVDYVSVTVALAVQVGACWLGVTRTVP